MKKLRIIVVLFIILAVIYGFYSNIKDEHILATENKKMKPEKYNKEIDDMQVIINNQEYTLKLENNETVESLIELLPLEINMNELNGNEKYYYLDETLPINSSIPSIINKGDVMLYDNNCLVIFYETFTTNYSYTKIGHIKNLPDLGSENIKIIFSK